MAFWQNAIDIPNILHQPPRRRRGRKGYDDEDDELDIWADDDPDPNRDRYGFAPEDSLPGIFRAKQNNAPVEPDPVFKVNSAGKPVEPKYSEDEAERLKQKRAYARAMMAYKPKNSNSRVKSALITAGRGALAGLGAGGIGGAIGGAVTGGIHGAVDPTADEKHKYRKEMKRIRGEYEQDLKDQEKLSDLDDAGSRRDLQRAQSENLRNLPGRERDERYLRRQRMLADMFNGLGEFDEASMPDFAKALREFGLPTPKKSRAKRTQINIDQKTGAVSVISTDPTTGKATSEPVTKEGSDEQVITTTGSQMSAERQESSQKFQREQLGRRQLIGQEAFNARQAAKRSAEQDKLIRGIEGVRSQLEKLDAAIAELEAKRPEPGSEDAKALTQAKKNRETLYQLGAKTSGQLNAMGEYESAVGEKGYPYHKPKQSQQGQSKYTEAEVRARARQAGKDEGEAVKRARKAGLIR